MELPFREVYKCSWLKLPFSDKKCGNFPKQWVIFCVHNDSVPFLEVYADEKVALTHKPTSSYQLSNVLHITPSICPQDDDEFEFVITFPSDMLRFVASSQHQMMSWVKRLNAKLREMKLLAPNENLYTSHLPENKSHLLPTRDPNSPLPLPPAMPYIPPGVEPVSSSTTENSEETGSRAISSLATREEDQETSELCSITHSHIGSPNPDIPSTSHNRTAENLSNTNNSNNKKSNNVTVIEVSSSPGNSVFTFSDVSSEQSSVEQNTAVSIMPINSNFENVSINRSTSATDVEDRINQPAGNHTESENDVVNPEESFNQLINDDAVSEPALYEHVFLSVVPNIINTPQQTTLSSTNNALSSSNAIENHLTSPLASVNLSSSTTSQLPKMGRGRGNARGRRRSNSNSESSSSHQVAADRIRATGPTINASHRLQPPPHPFVNSDEVTNPRLTLREQQVMQLRREMSHPGGVRLQLRRKDCLNSIAFIDAFQAVWVAGWKQKEHPMLYTALHIGDQLISLGGKIVNSAADAQKLIRAWPSLYIEFVIRRVPCGRVYALRKEHEGQNLGIVQENNTAEIKEIVTKSIVAMQGLTSRVRTTNGLSWTTWYITEINGRPLNLFFKENEVRDRLNAVGLDMSLLVQPSDLVKQIKKQLKLLKNYKDYIVQ